MYENPANHSEWFDPSNPCTKCRGVGALLTSVHDAWAAMFRPCDRCGGTGNEDDARKAA